MILLNKNLNHFDLIYEKGVVNDETNTKKNIVNNISENQKIFKYKECECNDTDIESFNKKIQVNYINKNSKQNNITNNGKDKINYKIIKTSNSKNNLAFNENKTSTNENPNNKIINTEKSDMLFYNNNII